MTKSLKKVEWLHTNWIQHLAQRLCALFVEIHILGGNLQTVLVKMTKYLKRDNKYDIKCNIQLLLWAP